MKRLPLLVTLTLLGCLPSRPKGGELLSAPGVTVKRSGDRWSFHAPDGRPFFSLGVCCVDPGIPRAKHDPENPSYAPWRDHSDPVAWADETLGRLKSWGFTTAGAWSDFETLARSKEQTLWLTPSLQMGASSGMPWCDMWDEANVRNMDDAARERILVLRDDPHLLGYYSDNELGWWNATLWKMTLEQPAASGQRRRLIGLLRETYRDEWPALARDFDTSGATGWADLERGGVLFLRPGGNGVAVIRQFLGMLADRYYQLTRGVIRKYDRRALFLGDRYQSFYYPEAARAAAKYVDVVSINVNAPWNDGEIPRFQLDSLWAISHKPILVSEIYLASRANRSGNRNDHGDYPVADTQAARAAAARTTLTRVTRRPYVVGVDWFQYADEPTHGRYDGENFNFGLVDINGRPYEEMAEMFQRIARERPWMEPAKSEPDASRGVPRATGDPLADFTQGRALAGWDRRGGFVRCEDGEPPVADLYLTWTPEALYLGVYTLDIVEAAYYLGGFVPKADRAAWTVRVNGREPVRARIGAGLEALVSDPAVTVENVTGRETRTYTTAGMRIPAKLFGATALRAGDVIDLQCDLATHARAYAMRWRGRFALRDK